MPDEPTSEPVLGDGQCVENANTLIQLLTQLAECMQQPQTRGNIQRLRVQMRALNQDGAACELIGSVMNCLGKQLANALKATAAYSAVEANVSGEIKVTDAS